MNITHTTKEKIVGDRLKAIFDRQRDLMDKYHHIELKSGLMQTEDFPLNLHCKKSQARIKDFAWRVMEEIGESIDAAEQNDDQHFHEELVDALHFLTELTISVNVNHEELVEKEDGEDYMESLYNEATAVEFDDIWDDDLTFNDCVAVFVMNLGMMCNTLKNKPWKQSHMKTDTDEFHKKLECVWVSYFAVMSAAGLSSDDITDLYFRKSQVNAFRVRSQY